MRISKKEVLAELRMQKQLFDSFSINMGDLAAEFDLNSKHIKAAIAEKEQKNTEYLEKLRTDMHAMKKEFKQSFEKLQEQNKSVLDDTSYIKGHRPLLHPFLYNILHLCIFCNDSTTELYSVS